MQRSGEGRGATNLPLLEELPCQEAPARRLEQGDVPARLCVPLLLQPGQRARPEKHLREGGKKEKGGDAVPPSRCAGRWGCATCVSLSPPRPRPSPAPWPRPVWGFYSGFLFPRREEWRGWECTLLPLCRCAHPALSQTPKPAAGRDGPSGVLPGSSPCGSCSSPGPATPGAPPLPVGRDRGQEQGAGPQGTGPQGVPGTRTRFSSTTM